MNKMTMMLVLLACDQFIECLEKLSKTPLATLTKEDLILVLEKWRQCRALMKDK